MPDVKDINMAAA